jgi:hypothetical protein
MSGVVVESRFLFLVAVDRVVTALVWCRCAFCSSGSSSARLVRVVEQFRGMVLRMSRCGLCLFSDDGGVGYGAGFSVGAGGFPNFPMDRDVSSCFLRLYAEGIIISPQVPDGFFGLSAWSAAVEVWTGHRFHGRRCRFLSSSSLFASRADALSMFKFCLPVWIGQRILRHLQWLALWSNLEGGCVGAPTVGCASRVCRRRVVL